MVRLFKKPVRDAESDPRYPAPTEALDAGRERDAGQHRASEKQRGQTARLLGVEAIVRDEGADPHRQCHQIHHAGAVRNHQRDAPAFAVYGNPHGCSLSCGGSLFLNVRNSARPWRSRQFVRRIGIGFFRDNNGTTFESVLAPGAGAAPARSAAIALHRLNCAPAAPATPAALPAAASAAHYSVSTTTVGKMLDDPAANAVLKKMIPTVYANEMFQTMGRDLTLTAIQQYEPEGLSNENLAKLQAELNKLPAPKG